jgi:hypothetical protein
MSFAILTPRGGISLIVIGFMIGIKPATINPNHPTAAMIKPCHSQPDNLFLT